jgi:hypothetical protein
LVLLLAIGIVLHVDHLEWRGSIWRRVVMSPGSLVMLILQCTEVASVWKPWNEIVWEVRLLIISWRSILRWCDTGSIKVGNVLLVGVPVFAKKKSSHIGHLTSRIITEGVVVLRSFSLWHGCEGGKKAWILKTFYRNSDEHGPSINSVKIRPH